MDPARGETNHTGMDVLAAFFIAYHHGGALRLHTASPDAPGFELLLPLDPEAPERPQLDPAWLDHVYSNLEA